MEASRRRPDRKRWTRSDDRESKEPDSQKRERKRVNRERMPAIINLKDEFGKVCSKKGKLRMRLWNEIKLYFSFLLHCLLFNLKVVIFNRLSRAGPY